MGAPVWAVLGCVFAVMTGYGMTLTVLPYHVDRVHELNGLGPESVALHVGTLTGVFSLAQLAVGPVVGRLADRTGRRPVLVTGLVSFVASQALFAATTWLPAMYALRVAGGMATSAIVVSATALVVNATSPQERSSGMAWIGTAAGLGFVAGPALGGVLGSSGLLHAQAPDCRRSRRRRHRARRRPVGGEGSTAGLRRFLADGPPVDAVGHRIVHGGTHLSEATLVTAEVEAAIAALAPLAPLHQDRALSALAAARRTLPRTPHVACFDSAFHSTLSMAARTYALPRSWRERWNLDRFGFRGLSHAWAAARGATVAGVPGSVRTVTCHLGGGASLCAVVDGRSVDTTMGFTPLDGIVMATRAGAVDPGLLLWLLTHGGLDAGEVAEGLERRAGLAGLFQSGDMRHVLAARAGGDADAALGFDVYVHRLRQGIASMAASMGGLDLLVFTGGVGEHAAPVRADAAEGLAFLGVEVDRSANEMASKDADISAAGAAVRTVVVTAREDLEIARQVRGLLGRLEDRR